MAGEHPDFRRKHHRSPDDGVEEGSKRRKHSHRRSSHCHHHHHRHRSGKHKHETKHEEEEEEANDLVSHPPLPVLVVSSPNSRPEDEGEVFEEEDFGVATVPVGKSPKSERSADMFCDDIFGESPAGVRKMGKGDGLQVERSGHNDSYRFGEVLDGRYEVTAAHRKGVFSTVVRAKDLKPGKDDPEEVAIKIIRNNDTMYKAGLEELVILKKLVGADPEDRRHCVQFL